MGYEPAPARWLLTLGAVAFIAALVGVPLCAVFAQALERGAGPYLAAMLKEESRHAIRLTLLTAAISVPLNTLFGLCAAWLLASYRFPGRRVLLTLIDLPFSVSPVIAGLLFVLLFGRQGLLRPFVEACDVKVIFAVPGIALATTFVTFPFVAREVLPVLESQGQAEEEAALTLGASGWQVFRHVTLPKIRWGLLYGVVLCNARAMGEFGAVSVVSGHIRGQTNTLPLQVEILYNEYDFVGAFALASLLALLAIATLCAKKIVEHLQGRPR